MNRRNFIFGSASTLALAAAAPVLAPPAPPADLLPFPAIPRSSLYADLLDTTRRAFLPRLQVQLYVRSPLLVVDWDDPVSSH